MGLGKAGINGFYLRDHFGGVTVWGSGVTDHVVPGEEAWITVAATDANEGLSGYNSGVILRSIRLVALPQDYVTRFPIEPVLDGNYNNAVLKVWVAMSFNKGASSQVHLTLRD